MSTDTSPTPAPVKIDVWSDIACPWCYVGKRRMETAVAAFAERGGAVEIEYHSFELSPETPVDFAGGEADFLAAHKGMPREQAASMLEQMTQLAATEGLAYDFGSLQHTNTVLAHQVLHLAKEHGVQVELKERLLKAYFVEGRHVGRVDDLVELAAEVGIDRDVTREALESGRYLESVRADQEQALEYGINGVPFFVLDGRLGVSGAQDPQVLLGALEQAAGVEA
ncbi:MAG: DsbA family oxidoreductase [Actinomycetales bacterium]|nr:MAG: DsbA family oxidoreductase [Actinomycetales bacterium]